MPRARVVLTGIALLLPVLAALAQQDPVAGDPPQEGPVRYTVEVIVFTYADASSAGNEVFAPPAPLTENLFGGDAPEGGLSGDDLQEGPVFDDRSPSVTPDVDEEPAGPLGEIPARARIELERLEPEAFRMQETWRRLQRLDAYRPILHAAWTQTTHDKALSPALPLRTLSTPPLGLDGSITLYQSRFLHLDVDVTLDASSYDGPSGAHSATDRLVDRGSAEPPADGARAPDETGDRLIPPVRYRITEDRIMRDGDVRYFDHPRFGMLARVSRTGGDEATHSGEAKAAQSD